MCMHAFALVVFCFSLWCRAALGNFPSWGSHFGDIIFCAEVLLPRSFAPGHFGGTSVRPLMWHVCKTTYVACL